MTFSEFILSEESRNLKLVGTSNEFEVPADNFMIVTTSNMKSSDLGKGFVMKDTPHIDGVLQPLIMTNNYLSV